MHQHPQQKPILDDLARRLYAGWLSHAHRLSHQNTYRNYTKETFLDAGWNDLANFVAFHLVGSATEKLAAAFSGNKTPIKPREVSPAEARFVRHLPKPPAVIEPSTIDLARRLCASYLSFQMGMTITGATNYMSPDAPGKGWLSIALGLTDEVTNGRLAAVKPARASRPPKQAVMN